LHSLSIFSVSAASNARKSFLPPPPPTGIKVDNIFDCFGRIEEMK